MAIKKHRRQGKTHSLEKNQKKIVKLFVNTEKNTTFATANPKGALWQPFAEP